MTKFMFNRLMKDKKYLKDIRLFLEKIDLSKFTIVIDKAYMMSACQKNLEQDPIY
jgi:hypothetical protein